LTQVETQIIDYQLFVLIFVLSELTYCISQCV